MMLSTTLTTSQSTGFLDETIDMGIFVVLDATLLDDIPTWTSLTLRNRW